MKRRKAIKLISSSQLELLSLDERSDQLETMLQEDWAELNEWKELPSNFQQEFRGGKLLKDASNTEYDKVLSLWLEDSLQAVTNDSTL